MAVGGHVTLVDGGAPVREVGWVQTETGSYVDESAAIGRLCGMGWSFADADLECAHGRLAGDPTKPCGCWPTEAPDFKREPTRVVHVATPDLMNILTRKEPLMLNTGPERLALPAGPPYGYKLDGTPRKSRAGRTPGKRLTVVNPIVPEPDPVRDAIEAAANLPAPPAPTAVAHVTTGTLLAKVIEDFDAEIARLQAAKATLLAVLA